MIPNNKLVTDKVFKYVRGKVEAYRINDSWETFYQEAIGYILLNEVSLYELRTTYRKLLREIEFEDGFNPTVNLILRKDFPYGFVWFNDNLVDLVYERYPDVPPAKLVSLATVYYYHNYFNGKDWGRNILKEMKEYFRELGVYSDNIKE